MTDAEYTSRRRKRNIAYVQGYLATHPCVRCGYDGPAKQFHHRDPTEKDSAVSRLVHSASSLKRIAGEIAKTDVVCCVCHHEIHASGTPYFWG